MFKRTNTEASPWIIVKANRKSTSRIVAFEKVLELTPYKGKYVFLKLDLTISKTSNFMVINHSCCLHVRIHYRRTNKFKASFF
ncbi:hypothetical protein [Lacinutrix jangbogonensis]|uniref:hypothetical protein n=1 Tax=Lacinutrix jangbogonensis TaxID=1469557 RepID=UPI0012E0739A